MRLLKVIFQPLCKKRTPTKFSYREVPSVKWMDDKGLISQVDDPRDTIARLEGCHGTGDELTAREVLDGPMIIAVLNILPGKHQQALAYKKQDNYFEYSLSIWPIPQTVGENHS